MVPLLENVAVIGAGLGGCALALTLSLHGIPVSVFESRSPDAELFSSGVVLTPNGLRILDKLGVLAHIKDRCYLASYRTIRNEHDEIVSKVLTADESIYGYRNYRVWRRILLDEMREMLAERAVPIEYHARFNGIVSEGQDGVVFRIEDDQRQASLLIGSDGIYSSVRGYIAPEIQPEYTGIVGVLSHIRWNAVKWPSEDYERNATLQGRSSSVFYIAEDPKAETIMVGMQAQYPEQTRDDLAALQADKDKLAGLYQNLYEGHGSTARRIIERVCQHKEDIWIWPYMRMPQIAKWYSSAGRVILVGDGAHALPPSGGQGINQALEDVYSLALVLRTAEESSEDKQTKTVEFADALAFWQQLRQQKIDRIFDWATNSQNVDRMSEAERQKLAAEGKLWQDDDMSWLYGSDIEEDIKGWIAERRKVA